MNPEDNRRRLQRAALQEHAALVEQSAAALRHSLSKCAQVGIKPEYTLDELDHFESSKQHRRGIYFSCRGTADRADGARNVFLPQRTKEAKTQRIGNSLRFSSLRLISYATLR